MVGITGIIRVTMHVSIAAISVMTDATCAATSVRSGDRIVAMCGVNSEMTVATWDVSSGKTVKGSGQIGKGVKNGS